MNPKSPHSRDPEALLDLLFQPQELASDGFSGRVLSVVRRKRRRARIIRLSLWSGAAAAVLMVFVGIRGVTSSAEFAAGDFPVSPEGIQLAAGDAQNSGPEAVISGQNVIFYNRALALGDLLAEAAALSDQESEEMLDFLMVLAGN